MSNNYPPTPILNYFANNGYKLKIKLEGMTMSGSMKDRAASFLIEELIKEKIINKSTTLIESSSGNMAIALATHARRMDLKFIGVIDPNITSENSKIINALGVETILVDHKDSNGGYLNTRLKTIQNYLAENSNAYWTNQYDNPYCILAYKELLAKEIDNQLQDLDYIFVPVSTGGTIAGISAYFSENNLKTKVIGVDVVGSVVFGQKPKARFLSGIGASVLSGNLKSAKIFDKAIVNEKNSIKRCHDYTRETGMLIGGSSGATLLAAENYLINNKVHKNASVLLIFPDRGDRYLSTIYSSDWFKKNYGEKNAIS
jgi:2,3-diaminopropionate biosynthesis protein SbnA